MDLPLSPVVEDLSEQVFQTVELESSCCKPKIWFRFVDKNCIAWFDDEEIFLVILAHLSYQHSDIKFTTEI